MINSKSISTLMSSSTNLNKFDGVPIENPSLYRSVVGTLQYCILTQLEIAFFVNKLCQFMAQPTNVYWFSTKRIIHYLKSTSHLSLLITKSSSVVLAALGMQIGLESWIIIEALVHIVFSLMII